ncbi:MAG: phosphoglucosamine mutase [Candidatus Omnitrophota bacterium]
MEKNAHKKLFGTDGIRGTPGEYPLTDEMIFRIGSGVAHHLRKIQKENVKQKIVIGKDTRATSSHLEGILATTITVHNIEALGAGFITTPGLSFLVKKTGADMGIMISASHNRAQDNGIKLFDTQGFKLSEVEEADIEDMIFSDEVHAPDDISTFPKHQPAPLKSARKDYVNFLLSTMEGFDLKGVKVALDCACGATSPFAKRVLKDLGAAVFAINDKPHGDNINTGGALDPEELCDLVLTKKADMGLALDGDGDRGIVVDDKGNILDGDRILAIAARYLLKKGRLAKKTVVATVMSNIGLRQAIAESGGKIICTKVGDKYVLEEIRKNDLTLGGEQSGHIIFYEYLPTPDGIVTGLQMLKVMKNDRVPLSVLAECMTKFPQILVNIPVTEKRPFEKMPSVSSSLKRFNDQLKDEGRILLRYSGTEQLARVMVEGKDKGSITEIANSLADEIKKEIGAGC